MYNECNMGTVSPWRLEVQVGDTIRRRHQKQLANGSYLQFCAQSYIANHSFLYQWNF